MQTLVNPPQLARSAKEFYTSTPTYDVFMPGRGNNHWNDSTDLVAREIGCRRWGLIPSDSRCSSCPGIRVSFGLDTVAIPGSSTSCVPTLASRTPLGGRASSGEVTCGRQTSRLGGFCGDEYGYRVPNREMRCSGLIICDRFVQNAYGWLTDSEQLRQRRITGRRIGEEVLSNR